GLRRDGLPALHLRLRRQLPHRRRPRDGGVRTRGWAEGRGEEPLAIARTPPPASRSIAALQSRIKLPLSTRPPMLVLTPCSTAMSTKTAPPTAPFASTSRGVRPF